MATFGLVTSLGAMESVDSMVFDGRLIRRWMDCPKISVLPVSGRTTMVLFGLAAQMEPFAALTGDVGSPIQQSFCLNSPGWVNSKRLEDGTVWFSTPSTAYRFDPKGKVTTYLPSVSLFGGEEAADGSVWFHTDRRAVRFKQGAWVAYGVSDGFLEGTVHRLFSTSDGTLWFGGTHEGESAFACYDGNTWKIHTVKDGLIDKLFGDVFHEMPVRETVDGTLWIGGQHGGRAAVCRYDPSAGPGQRAWMRYTEADGFFGDRVNHIYEASDGTVWFGARSDRSGRDDEGSGLFRFDPRAAEQDAWTRYTEPDSLFSTFVTGIAEWPEGTLWVGTVAGIGRLGLDSRREEGHWWYKTDFSVVRPKPHSFTVAGDALWFAYAHSRHAGAVRYDGREWRTYSEVDEIGSTDLYAIHQSSDSALWFVSQKGLSRFDGEQWANYTDDYRIADGFIRRQRLRETRDGSFWIGGREVLHFRRETGPTSPETFMEPAVEQVSSAGNILLKWFGRDRWDDTSPDDLRFQFRVNEDAWSISTNLNTFTFTGLSAGSHDFGVRAVIVSHDGNVDPTPAVHAFVVEAPWWRNPVVAGPGLLIIVFALFQTGRVVQRDRRLREGNQALSDANKELFQVNVDLQREQVLERLRGQAQGMQSSEDIKPVVEAVYRELNGLGLKLSQSSICIDVSETESEVWSTGEDGPASEPFTHRQPFADEPGEAHSEKHADVEITTITTLTAKKPKLSSECLSRAVIPFSRPCLKMSGPGEHDTYWVFFEQGRVALTSEEPIAEEYLLLIKRFGEVFGYAHSRYKELQEKEAQNQELKNQYVLERLRGQAQGMQSSEDIKLVVEAVYRELTGLGLPLIETSIQIHHAETEVEIWSTDDRGRVLEPFITPATLTPVVERQEALRRDEDYSHRHMEREELVEVRRRLIAEGDLRWKDVPEEQWPQETDLYRVFFDGGGIWTASEEPIAEEYLMLIKRFGEVFGYAHSRHKELQVKEAQNRRLAVEASVQRLRAEVQSMDEASDFERILSLLIESLKTVELTFDGCEIDVLDEPVEAPTMAHFETNGFRYTTFRLDPDGNVAPQTYNVAAPFQPVNERTIERFIAGEPWQGTSEGEAIVEVPAGPYGRLRLTATDRQNFAEDEVVTLREFADAVALGYARCQDFQQLEEQNRSLRQQRAVERIRAEAMGMRSSDDLCNVMAAMLQEMIAQGIQTPTCWITFIDEDSDELIEFGAFKHLPEHDLLTSSPSVTAIDKETSVYRKEKRISSLGEEDWGDAFVRDWRKESPQSFSQSLAVDQVAQYAKETYGVTGEIVDHPEVAAWVWGLDRHECAFCARSSRLQRKKIQRGAGGDSPGAHRGCIAGLLTISRFPTS